MRIYLDGTEYYTFRKIMRDVGVRYGCLNYEYIIKRVPNFNLEKECEFLDELIVYPGNLGRVYLRDYMDFLSRYSQVITFAVELYTKERVMLDEDCGVDVIPIHKKDFSTITLAPAVAVNASTIKKPFIVNRLQKLYENGTIIHGIHCELPIFNSMNSNVWMQGDRGWVSYFDKNNKMILHRNLHTITALARSLREDGYSIDLNKVKRLDWKEMAKINCISWMKYAELKERL